MQGSRFVGNWQKKQLKFVIAVTLTNDMNK